MTKRIIGLTGGIATGKTTVANYLATAYNLPILDADIYAREAVSIGSPILHAIAQRYGQQILLPDGNLNRQGLGEIIFNNQEERNWVENLIHPYVRDRFLQAVATSTTTLVLVIPLLFEANMTDCVTEIWVVSCSQEEQLQRLIQRNHLTKEQALARIQSQLPLEEKAARANFVINNSSTVEELLKQVDVAILSSNTPGSLCS
ncbi:dephospho-CoA kinase [Aetokthonos hydrillicola Thurmond2011]|jgi:dephospho-CoA kinase|uniref:Dephospho-CoA kinase n=1 Tax=Aetokthonos hydrillicola Thurmond2011 TaxID=2712845 RepID=A0AAP5MBX2_9CYAN|nr:dephospho-CoA kinase [Aetokthonos hydrillicola]MBO3461123.1 dephospho-CoA kinase [Aetokthonos hydrillicola CCALA 1050]MBW4586892.1 dephospho-CoA kinase [Aetokthonos hydrillicola CCALA 1050]MDR9897633.1 dephospho-CoA kinase [Aetokthonos hydrillicola Thurmond2011]